LGEKLEKMTLQPGTSTNQCLAWGSDNVEDRELNKSSYNAQEQNQILKLVSKGFICIIDHSQQNYKKVSAFSGLSATFPLADSAQ
jgi:hypothetical protein